MKRSVCALTVCLVAAATPARAGKYAAMDQVAVEGGELRLVRPSGSAIGFPLRHTSYELDLSGPMAQVEVEQLFENPFDEPLEAVYLFPLASEAAVVDYEIIVGDRTVRGRIDRREAARARYDEARAAGQTAALLEEHKRNVFSQSVANIPARQAVRVRFVYVELLEPRDGGYELVVPMVVGPRYLPGQTADPRPVSSRPAGTAAPAPGGASVPYLPPGSRSGHEVSLHACIDAGVPLGRVESPTHAIVEKRTDETSAEVSLAGEDTIPNKDFVLRYGGGGDATLVGLLTHRTGDEEGFFTLVVQPKATYRTGDIRAREMVLVIDRSGSMDGAPLAQAKAVARALLDSLGPRDSFNVLAFSDGVDSFAGAPVVADADARRRAASWIDALASGGGTELGRGVAASLIRQPGADRVRMVYIMTDGYVGNDDEIVAGVRGALAMNRVFPVGVGAAVNRALLERLADAGRGFASTLLPAEAPDELAAMLVRRTAYPFLTDVRLRWSGVEVSDLAPAVIPDVYAGLPLVVTGRYRRPGTGQVVVEATAAGKRTAATLDVELPARSDHPPVAYLWARRWVRELERRRGSEKAIAELGLRFHMVTAETSFVAVDEARGGPAATRTVVQAVELPEGVGWGAVGGAAEEVKAAPAPVPVASASPPPERDSRRSDPGWKWHDHHDSEGGGGGAIDFITLLGIAGFVPLARALRRRREG